MTEANLMLLKNEDAGHTNFGMLDKVFQYGNVQIRVEVDEDSNPWFVASDVCMALEHSNARKAIKNLVDQEDVTTGYTLTKGGKQKVNLINEAGVYALIFGSRKNTAKEFKRFVCSEILPAIRKRGMYLSQEKQRQLDELQESYELVRKELLRIKSKFGVESKEVKDYLLSVNVKCRDLDPVSGKAHTYCGVKKIRKSEMTPREKDAWNTQQMGRSSYGQLNRILQLFVNNKCYEPKFYQAASAAVEATEKLKDLLTFDNLVSKTIEIRDHSGTRKIEAQLSPLEKQMTQGELFAGDLQYFN